MRLLVPIPFDLSRLAHGRNLRVVNLMREVCAHAEVSCLVPEDASGTVAAVLPDARILAAPKDGSAGERLLPEMLADAYRLRRALEFHGYHPSLLAATHRHAAEFDVVLGFDLPSAVYLLAAAHAAADGHRPLLACDLIDDPWLTWKSWPLFRRLSATGMKAAVAANIIRRELLPRFDVLFAVSAEDAASLAQGCGRYVRVVPNGVQVQPVQWCHEREPLVVFTGAMSFPPNDVAARYLVRRIWPKVISRLTQEAGTAGGAAHVRLAIVGADPSPRLRRICTSAGVEVTGRVEDITAWLRRARVAVAPMITGTGVKNKVLEACAAGCPVVATLRGAAGLPNGPASGILVGRDTDRIARELTGLLLDAATARALGSAAQAMVRRQFSWSQAAARMLDTLNAERSLAGDSSSGTPSESAKEEALAYAAS